MDVIKGKFYLGKIFDPSQGKVTDQPLLYDSEDLTTHAVVVGMTGSGKTGLCIGLLEEAALNGIPALMLDPKGDITNTLLHFPALSPQDFEPWMDADAARREGKTIQQAAADAAASWKQGLADWGIAPERLEALQNSAHFAVYTPGSTAGIPVSILASLQAPQLAWESHREELREKISGTVTAILGLVGLKDIDPVRSREHILLSNIFEQAWSQGKDLDLGELILQTQSPPFAKLGVFDVNTFFPQKERFELAMLLNNILAAPSFQAWIEGQPLDIAQFMFDESGRPKHSVFYIAHLSDAERMFFVTLFYTAVESWMRTQAGSTSLRAIVYFDEIYGYIPPVANPPSKQVMLRMLKQARAFGVGQVLVTQNPVDIDYKGLSNAGTWCIGKLQTDQDKQRLLDGLESAIPGGMDRAAFDRLISNLAKRVFLMQNVHEKKPLLFQTRWAMNYLAGPLTRLQIPALNALAGASAATVTAAVAGGDSSRPSAPQLAAKKSVLHSELSATRPTAPAGVQEVFLPVNRSAGQAWKEAGQSDTTSPTEKGLIYRPCLFAQANIRYLNRKYLLDYEQHKAVMVEKPDRRGFVRWEDYDTPPLSSRFLESAPEPQARFAPLDAPLSEAKTLAAMQKDFVEWSYRSAQIVLKANEALKVYAGPETTTADFRTQCADAARKERDAEAKKLAALYDKKIKDIQVKLSREERELEQDEEELSQRRMEELGTHAENIFGLLGGRRSSRRVSSSLTKRRLTSQAKADVEESKKVIAELKSQIAAIEKEKEQALEELHQKWGEVANQISEIPLVPQKKDILLEVFGIAWVPYHFFKVGEQTLEVPAFQPQAEK